MLRGKRNEDEQPAEVAEQEKELLSRGASQEATNVTARKEGGGSCPKRDPGEENSHLWEGTGPMLQWLLDQT